MKSRSANKQDGAGEESVQTTPAVAMAALARQCRCPEAGLAQLDWPSLPTSKKP
jgi:hypothetical protein